LSVTYGASLAEGPARSSRQQCAPDGKDESADPLAFLRDSRAPDYGRLSLASRESPRSLGVDVNSCEVTSVAIENLHEVVMVFPPFVMLQTEILRFWHG